MDKVALMQWDLPGETQAVGNVRGCPYIMDALYAGSGTAALTGTCNAL